MTNGGIGAKVHSGENGNFWSYKQDERRSVGCESARYKYIVEKCFWQ